MVLTHLQKTALKASSTVAMNAPLQMPSSSMVAQPLPPLALPFITSVKRETGVAVLPPKA
jgi:hypothetical protein